MRLLIHAGFSVNVGKMNRGHKGHDIKHKLNHLSKWGHRIFFGWTNVKRQLYLMAICSKPLTHWGRVTHICVGSLTIIGSDNGLSPGRRQAIIWTNAGTLLIGHLGTNFNEIPIEIHTFSFKKMQLKMSSAKWRPFCLGLNVLIYIRKFNRVLISVTRMGGCFNPWIVSPENELIFFKSN